MSVGPGVTTAGGPDDGEEVEVEEGFEEDAGKACEDEEELPGRGGEGEGDMDAVIVGATVVVAKALDCVLVSCPADSLLSRRGRRI